MANSASKQAEIDGRLTMGSDAKIRAAEVIDSFKALLDSEVRNAIGDEHFHALHGMIREAIAEQSEAILERVDQNLAQIRSDMVERRPLEL